MDITWVVVGVTTAGFLFFQRKNIGKVLSIGNAQVNRLVKWFRGKNLIAVYQAEIDKAFEEASEYNEGLEKYKFLINRMQRLIAKNQKDIETYTTRTREQLALGNERKAEDLAVQLKKAQIDLTKNTAQLEVYEQNYQNNLKKVKFVQDRIRTIRERSSQFEADLQISKLEAEVSKYAQNFEIKVTSFDGINAIEEEIQEQIDQNRAKGLVIRDLSTDYMEEIECVENRERIEAKEVIQQMKLEMDKKKSIPPPKW